MELRPYQRYRPTRTPDGEGGFSQALGAPAQVCGAVRVYQNQVSIIVRREADVRVDDVIVLDSTDV